MRVLSFHARYQCRHSGQCCTARWPIPITAGARVHGCPGAQVPGELVAGDLVAGDLLPTDEHGCVFHDAERHRCRIHDAFGHDALPVACQQFPRVSVIDPRGASVTLSCFCPTALSMLDESDDPITIINHQSAISDISGLDARTSLPPALRPDLLMDWESWWEFERLAVEEFNRDEAPREIVTRLRAVVEDLRTWRPGESQLIDRVHAAFASGGLRDHSAPRTQNRFLACHAFANWTAHLGAGLRTWLRSLETVVFLIEEGWEIREIDEWLRHWADPKRLANAWSTSEKEKGRN